MKAIRLVLLALALIVCAAVPRAQQAADLQVSGCDSGDREGAPASKRISTSAR